MTTRNTVIAFFMLLVTSIHLASETGQSQYNVEVVCSASDPIGDKLCFAVKERIGGSSLFGLGAYRDRESFLISLKTRDPLLSYSGTRNKTTVASVAYLKRRNGKLEFLFHDIVMCGDQGVWCDELMLSELALSILDNLADHI